MIKRFFQFALVVLLLSVAALVSAVTTMHFAIHGTEVTVPDFRGMTEADAARKAAALDLDFAVDDRFFSATIPAGRILTQSPLPDTRVRREWHVRTTQSLGPQKVGIPPVLAQPERLATMEIRRVGLQVGTVARMPYAASAPGMVIAQIPSPGSAKVDRPSVSLLMSTPGLYTSNAYVMPDFVNGSYSAAAATIAHAGLKLAPVIYRSVAIPDVGTEVRTEAGTAGDPSRAPQSAPVAPIVPVTPGTVLAQSPTPGSRIDARSTLQLTVAQ
jgi:beta-lactam-binding protein with PASTA domain